MTIKLLRNDPATGATVLHAVGGPAMRKCAVHGGNRVAIYQYPNQSGAGWGPIVEADYSFDRLADALRLVDGDADRLPIEAKVS